MAILASNRNTSVGFRCWTDKFSFVVLSGTQKDPNLIAFKLCKTPAGQDRSELLVWLSKEIHEIIDKYKPNCGAYKATEPIARQKEILRGQLEGVLIYSSFSHSCKLKLSSRVKSSLKKLLGLTQKASEEDLMRFMEHETFSDLPKTNYGDACLVAFAELPTGDNRV